MFDIVVAADAAWGFGHAGGLPWPKLRGDLQHFRQLTSAASPGRRNAVIMGRRTWQSAEVAGRPLPGRLNLVVTRGALTVPDGVGVAPSLDAALAAAAAADAQATFLLGGAELIRAALDHPALGAIYLTRVAGAFPADVHLPDLDALGFVPEPWPGARDGVDAGVAYRIERLRRR